jgi:hypothetical protein
VAEGSKRLVEADAQARTELTALQRDLQQSQAEVGHQRDQLETDRRDIASQRARDPIVASAIMNVGLIVACLLPLLLCIYIVRSLRDHAETDTALAEILVQEMTGESTMLLPPPSEVNALPYETAALSEA